MSEPAPTSGSEPESEPFACEDCGEWVHRRRWALGYRTCRECGEQHAQAARKNWTVAPMAKSNYILITDRATLKELNPKR